MMKLLSILVAFFATAVSSVEVQQAKRVELGVYTSGNDLDDNAILLEHVLPVLTSPCGDALDWKFVFAGLTNETTKGEFTCIGGEKNCDYLETVNCVQDVIHSIPHIAKADESILVLAILGRGGSDRILEGLVPDLQDQVKKCKSSGKGKKLLSASIAETTDHVKFDPKLVNTMVFTLNNVQQKEVFVDEEGPWHPLCEATKDERCCLKLGKPDSAKMTNLRGVQDDNKYKIGVYASGNDVSSTWLLLDKVAPMLLSPCGDSFEFDFVFAGATNQTKDGSFQCLAGEKECEYLEGINCLYSALNDGRGDPSFANENTFMLGMLGRESLDNLREVTTTTSAPNTDLFEKCLKEKKGKKLLSEAIKKTQRDVSFFPPQDLFVALTVDGKQLDGEIMNMDVWATMCSITGSGKCCLGTKPQQPGLKVSAETTDIIAKK